MNKPDNVLMMLEWAEISGECVDCNQAEGQDIAQRKYEAYRARIAAQDEVRIIRSWNLPALRGLKIDTTDFRIKDDKYTQQVYRDMVRANARAA